MLRQRLKAAMRDASCMLVLFPLACVPACPCVKRQPFVAHGSINKQAGKYVRQAAGPQLQGTSLAYTPPGAPAALWARACKLAHIRARPVGAHHEPRAQPPPARQAQLGQRRRRGAVAACAGCRVSTGGLAAGGLDVPRQPCAMPATG